MSNYICLAQDVVCENIIKKSRFICNLMIAKSKEEVAKKLNEVKKAHYNATHNCFATVLKDGYVKYSDDGEPQGTAGLPMLEVLKHSGIVDVVGVVTRYFGGTLLGAGGLNRAYSGSVAQAVSLAQKVEMVRAYKYEFVVDYGDYSKLCSIAGEYDKQVTGEFASKVTANIVLEQSRAQAFEKRITEGFLGKEVYKILSEEDIEKFL